MSFGNLSTSVFSCVLGPFALCLCLSSITFSQQKIKFSAEPISYHSNENLTDRISQLHDQIASGEVTLKHAGATGYLRSILKELKIPEESQILVYSKTSLNSRYIRPKNPRAIYFNDDVYIGWTPETDFLEIASIDPEKGALFYTLKQDPDQKEFVFKRERRCLACHVSGSSTGSIPGVMVKSVVSDVDGKPIVGFGTTNHGVEIDKRWGGYFVIGRHGGQDHLGNIVGREHWQEKQQGDTRHWGLDDVPVQINPENYLSEKSDIVALMLLEHQTHLTNMLNRTKYEHRLGIKLSVYDKLLRYMFFVDEPRLYAPMRSVVEFDKAFEKYGVFDSKGRSLRKLEMFDRMFRYRCSYMIYSKAFGGLPKDLKEKIYRDMYNILTKDQSKTDYSFLPDQEKRAILEILSETKKDLPDFWKL